MAKPKILQDIEELKRSQLVGKYYIPTVQRVDNDPVTLTANPLPTTWTGSGTSYSNGDYTIESSMTPSGANPLNHAFNGSIYDEFIGIAPSSATNTVTLTLPEAIEVSSFNTYIPDVQGIDQVFIEGSTNKSTWRTLYTYSGLDYTLTTRNLSTTGNYRYYRIRFNMESNSNIRIIEWQMGEYLVDTASNHFTIPGIPNPMSENQRIMIKTPDYSATGVVSNTLNDTDIDMLLLPNRYYELVYDRSMYLAKEVV